MLAAKLAAIVETSALKAAGPAFCGARERASPANVGAAAARGAEGVAAVDVAADSVAARQRATNSTPTGARPGQPAAAGAKPSRPRLLLAALRDGAAADRGGRTAGAGGGAIF